MASAVPAHGEVASVGSSGFQVRNQVTVAAPLTDAYALTVQPSRWWSPKHTWSGDSNNLSLDLRPGGCWCERWAGGFAQHMQLVFLQPQKQLRFYGALGPLSRDGFAGGLEIAFAADGPRTIITMTYTVGGYSATMDMKTYAGIVDQVLGIQLARLKAVAEGHPPTKE